MPGARRYNPAHAQAYATGLAQIIAGLEQMSPQEREEMGQEIARLARNLRQELEKIF